MNTCFVIQPFDKGTFDLRYAETFEPAIRAANLDPYRVDRDPSVRTPIESIEEGIRTAKICFAEITSDNPNVWYELGYAFALNKDVVMVTEAKTKFPFDVQHKHIIDYKTNSKSGFEILQKDITTKLIAFLEKTDIVQHIKDSPIKDTQGLSSHESTMIFLIFENQVTENDSVSAYKLYRDMDAIGFTKIAANVAFRELKRKGFIEGIEEYSQNDGELYTAFKLTNKGEEWVLNNQDKIQFRKDPDLLF